MLPSLVSISDYSPRELARHRGVLSQHINVALPFTVAETVRMGAGDRHHRKIDTMIDTAVAEVASTARDVS